MKLASVNTLSVCCYKKKEMAFQSLNNRDQKLRSGRQPSSRTTMSDTFSTEWTESNKREMKELSWGIIAKFRWPKRERIARLETDTFERNGSDLDLILTNFSSSMEACSSMESSKMPGKFVQMQGHRGFTAERGTPISWKTAQRTSRTTLLSLFRKSMSKKSSRRWITKDIQLMQLLGSSQ